MTKMQITKTIHVIRKGKVEGGGKRGKQAKEEEWKEKDEVNRSKR